MRSLVILVIEDSEIFRRATSIQIESLGLRTDEAADGLNGFLKATSLKPAAIIMDVQMPGMTGIECTRKIREVEVAGGLKSVPIIGYTGAEDFEEVKEACLGAGMDECLPKSCAVTQLTFAIEKYVLAPKGFGGTGSGAHPQQN